MRVKLCAVGMRNATLGNNLKMAEVPEVDEGCEAK